MTIIEATVLIEKFLRLRGIDPGLVFADNGEINWSFFSPHGKLLWIDLFSDAHDTTSNYFSAFAPLMRVTDRKKEDFYLDCLRINDGLNGSAICVRKGWIFIKVLRGTEGLSLAEIERIMSNLSDCQHKYLSTLDLQYADCWNTEVGHLTSFPNDPNRQMK